MVRRSALLVLIVGIFQLAPQVVGAQPGPVLVFAGFQRSDWPQQVTEEVASCLVKSLRETGRFANVVVTDLGGLSPVGSARQLGGDLVLHGDLSRNGNMIVIHLLLERVADGERVDDRTLTYNSRRQLLAECPTIARRTAEIGGAAIADLRRPPDNPDSPDPPKTRPEIRTRLKMGMEGVSSGPSVPGGAYLYYDLLSRISRVVGLGARYGLASFPFDFDSHLVSASVMFDFRLADELYTAFGPAYLLSTDYESPPTHFLGLRVSPFHSGDSADVDEISIEILPFSLFFDLENGRGLFTLELLSIGIWLPL